MPPTLDGRIRAAIVAQVDGGDLAVPLLSSAVTRLLAATETDDTNVSKVAQILKSDPALAGNLLRLSNSSVYTGRERVVTVQQAICRLGTATLRQMALVIATRTRTFKVDGRERQVRRLFAHSLAAALFAQEVARLRRLGVEEAFMIGLFHDVGRPILLQALVDLHGELGLPMDDEAMAPVVQGLHARAGARVIAAWQLSPRLAEAVARHHDYDATSPLYRDAALASFADALARTAIEPEPGAEAAARDHDGIPLLGLYPEEVTRLLAHGPRIAAQVAEIA
jgi:putative nucleotidyltransferase with HDIG domain